MVKQQQLNTIGAIQKNCSEEVPRTSKTEKDKLVFIKFTAQSTVQGYTIKAKDNERKTMMIKLK